MNMYLQSCQSRSEVNALRMVHNVQARQSRSERSGILAESNTTRAYRRGYPGDRLESCRVLRNPVGMAQTGSVRAIEMPRLRNKFIMRDLSDYRSTEIAARILAIRKRKGEYKGLRQFEVHSEINSTLIEYLASNGEFYFDKMLTYYLDRGSEELIILNPKVRRTELFLSHFGLSPLEDEYKRSLKALELHALDYGSEAKVHSFSHYCRKTNALYLFDQDKHVYRITTQAIERFPNGIDSILFFNRTGSKTFELTSLDIHPVSTLFNDLLLSPLEFSESALSPEEFRLILHLWFLNMFFPDLSPTKPILAVIGDHGSGKTTFMRSIGIALTGSTFQVTQLPNEARSFDVLLANSHYVAIDNADSRVRWLEDRLAIAATGGAVKVRRLYSDSDLCELEITANLAISSRTPQFRRPDIADRCLIIPLEQIDVFRPETVIQGEIIVNRNAILTELVFQLQQVLRALEEQNEAEYQSHFRMADFASFSLKIASYVGKQDQMADILERLSVKQEEFAAEGEPLIDLLEFWLRNPGNDNRPIEAADLYSELSVIAKDIQINFSYIKGSRSLAQKLGCLSRSHGHNLIIQRTTGAGRKGLWSIQEKVAQSRESNE